MIRLTNIKMKLEGSREDLKKKSAALLKTSEENFLSFRIAKKSLDARDKSHIKFIYSVDIELENEQKYLGIKNVSKISPYLYILKRTHGKLDHRPVVVGSGPAGLFAGLILAEAGLGPIILERGRNVDARKKDVDLFWSTGVLNKESNALFGEGGAGTFSDGKLTTGIKDERIGKVISEFIEAGAPEEIAYLAKPHIGTDKLIGVLKSIREKIIGLGGEIRFQNKFSGLSAKSNRLVKISVESPEGSYELETGRLILAIGHSARDTYEVLLKNGVTINQKAFSVGFRIEHHQELINRIQYGNNYDKNLLDAADYKLSTRLANGRGVYTFCMCPGGVVVASASEDGGVVTNGMSLHSRADKNANSALLVSVGPNDFRNEHPLAGVQFQRELERLAYRAGGGGYRAPAQRVSDFLKGRPSESFGAVEPSYAPGVTPADLNECFSDFPFIAEGIKEALITSFNKKMNGFASGEAILTAIETRSSSPVTIIRDKTGFMSGIYGLYPCGEGAGYAGGIISAAVDGIRTAEAVIDNLVY